MSGARSQSRPACVEECDENTGETIAGTAKYARSRPSTPVKEQSNIGRSRRVDNGGRRGRSPPPQHFDYSDSEPLRTRTRPGPEKTERPKRPTINTATRQRVTAPNVIQTPASARDESEFYGVPSSGHPDKRPPFPRQRAHTGLMGRPPSFHGGDPRQMPPPPFGRFPGGGPPGPPPSGGPNGHLPTSFPPPSWYQSGGPGPGPNMPPPPPPRQQYPHPMARTPLEGPPTGYPFPPHPSSYGGPPGHPPGPPGRGAGRPHSSIGHRHRQGPSYDFDAAFEPDEVSGGPPSAPGPPPIPRRQSVTSQPRRKENRMSMPPPPPSARPQSARPANSVMFRPPPPERSSPRKVNFSSSPEEDESEDDDEVEYLDAHGGALEYNPRAALPAPPTRSVANRSHARRPSVNDRSASYSQPGMGRENPARRHSLMYPASFTSALPEDDESEDELKLKMRNMRLHMSGAPAPPPQHQRLTHGALRRASNRGGGSSRSTESSESYGESEMPSHTTRTSHSNGDENGGAGVKIRGANRIKIGGVDVELGGAEIEISASKNGENKGSYRDDASTMYRGDARSRYEPMARPTLPQRNSGRTESFSRSRTAYPQLTSGYPPPPSHYGQFTQSPATSFPSPARALPELEWPQEPWGGGYAERSYYR